MGFACTEILICAYSDPRGITHMATIWLYRRRFIKHTYTFMTLAIQHCNQ